MQQFIRQATVNGARPAWYLQLDIHNYFMSIDRDILFGTGPDKGLPIGNLNSQFFANMYLNRLDQFVKHELGSRHYVRYGFPIRATRRNLAALLSTGRTVLLVTEQVGRLGSIRRRTPLCRYVPVAEG